METRTLHAVPLVTLLAAVGGSSALPPDKAGQAPQPCMARPGDATVARFIDSGTGERHPEVGGLRYGSGFEARDQARLRRGTPLTDAEGQPTARRDLPSTTVDRESAGQSEKPGADHVPAFRP